MNHFLRVPRKLALWAIATMTAAASITSFAESYRALYLWAVNHSVPGFWANVWPIQIDVFIAIGEVALFVGLVDTWHHRKRWFPWAVALIGLTVSVAGNVGHAPTSDFATRLTFAVPPLTAFASLIVGMGVLKRVVDLYSKQDEESDEESGTEQVQAEDVPQVAQVRTSAPIEPPPASAPRRPLNEVLEDAERTFAPELAAGTLPSHREVREKLGVGQSRTDKVREHLQAEIDKQANLGSLVTRVDQARGTTEQDDRPDDFDTVTLRAAGHPAGGQLVRSYQTLPVTPQGR